MNKDLTNDKFDDYHPFIFLIYDCLNRKSIQPYKKIYLGEQNYPKLKLKVYYLI